MKAQVLCDLAEGIRWTVANLADVHSFEELKKRAIGLRASGDRQAAPAALALLEGDNDQAGVDGKAETIWYCVGARCEAILNKSGGDELVGTFKLNWVTPRPYGVMMAPLDFLSTIRALGVPRPLR